MRKLFAHIISALIPFRRIRRKVRDRLIGVKKPATDLENLVKTSINVTNDLRNMVKVSVDITRIPPATGDLALIQKSSLCILSAFAKIMEKHKIKWWIDSGTLIGHIRHNGFIPWDDDIDIAIMRDDHEKMFAILDKEFAGNGFHYARGEITRLWYKDTPAQVDVYPIDTGYSAYPPRGKEYDDFMDKLFHIKQDVHFDYKKLTKQIAPVPAEQIENALDARDKILVQKCAPCGFLFYGVETLVLNRCLFSYDDVFPLKPAVFLGIETWIPNNAEYWLWRRYGDFMGWPYDCVPRHAEIVGRLTADNYKECQKLIREYLPEIR